MPREISRFIVHGPSFSHILIDYHIHTTTTAGPSKYVPPHLRNATQSSGADVNNNNSNDSSSNNVNGNNNYPRPSSLSASYQNSGGGRGGGNYGPRSGGSGGGGRGYDRGPPAPPPPQNHQNSRWSNTDTGGGGGGGGYNGGGRGSGRGGYNGGSSSSLGGPRRNSRNFHGDMNADKRLEQRLFHTGDKQTTGINFDNYDKIPCEVTGKDIPLPIDTYTVETIGEDLFRNTQLCGYARPTPVQKYSIPIGQQGRDLMACAQTGSGVRSHISFLILSGVGWIRRSIAFGALLYLTIPTVPLRS